MKNLEAVIKSHNSKFLRKVVLEKTEKKCNCRNKEKCPLNRECLVKCVVYKANSKKQKQMKDIIMARSKDLLKRGGGIICPLFQMITLNKKQQYQAMYGPLKIKKKTIIWSGAWSKERRLVN